ncbi:MAG: hypothetical protein ACOYD0_04470 [Candidatus Nanopelagicales bacterium]
MASRARPNNPERSYGMAIVDTASWLGHTGEIPGYNTVLNYSPDTHTTIVVMVSSDIGTGPQNQQTAPGVAALAALVESASGGLKMGERVAVVLSGTAARDAFQAGTMARLVPELTAQGSEPTVLLGTTAGGINAAERIEPGVLSQLE